MKDFRITYVEEEQPKSTSSVADEFSYAFPLAVIDISPDNFKKILKFLKDEIDNLLEALVGGKGGG